MTHRVLVCCACLLYAACSPKPVPWTAPPVSLPASEHASALPVKFVSMVPTSLSQERWEALDEGCEERRAALPPEPEPEELEEEETPPAVESATREASAAPSSVSEVLDARFVDALNNDIEAAGLLGELLEDEPPATPPRPLALPDVALAPAVLSISLTEMAWMGKSVASLEQGAFPAAEAGTHELAPLHDAVKATLDTTREALRRCGDRSHRWVRAALVVADARVPVATFNRGIYNLAMAGVESVALAVHDDAPDASRLERPAGGKDRHGTLTVTQTDSTWVSQASIRGGCLQDEPVEPPSPPVTWARTEPLPRYLGESAPPAVALAVGTRSPLAELVRITDALSAMETYCVSLALGADASSQVEAAPVGSATSLRLEVGKTVIAHVLTAPLRATNRTRIDGSRCQGHTLVRFETRRSADPERADEPRERPIGLKDLSHPREPLAPPQGSP